MTKYKKVLFVSDIHCPYQDKLALKAMYHFMDWFKPQEVIILGDLVDFYAVSRFSRQPERVLKLQDELDQAVGVLEQIRQHALKVNIYFLRGNHCDRLKKYLWSEAQELSGLRALRLEELLQFDRLKIKYEDKNQIHYKNVIIKHGSIVRKFAGYTAKGEFEKNGLSGVSGHSHRLAQYRHTNEADSYIWTEAGCLCQLDADYLEGCRANWQQGFAIGYFKENSNRFLIETVPIINKRAMYGGKEF
jgi:UDP-2,3-diacylglucosamine pyrophosphatase LpxH